MLWTPNKTFSVDPFELEKDLETAISEVKDALFKRIISDTVKDSVIFNLRV